MSSRRSTPDLYEDRGYSAVTGISRSPKTSFNPGKLPDDRREVATRSRRADRR